MMYSLSYKGSYIHCRQDELANNVKAQIIDPKMDRFAIVECKSIRAAKARITKFLKGVNNVSV